MPDWRSQTEEITMERPNSLHPPSDLGLLVQNNVPDKWYGNGVLSVFFPKRDSSVMQAENDVFHWLLVPKTLSYQVPSGTKTTPFRTKTPSPRSARTRHSREDQSTRPTPRPSSSGAPRGSGYAQAIPGGGALVKWGEQPLWRPFWWEQSSTPLQTNIDHGFQST